MLNNSNNTNQQENVFLGIIGAVLFSLVGGILWFLFWQINIIAGISGAVGVICAMKGYKFFGKQESIKGVVISIIATVIVIVAAWYLCLSFDFYNAYQEAFAEGTVDFTITFGEAVQNAFVCFEDKDIASGYIMDLLFGLAFCVIAGISYVRVAIRRAKLKKDAEAVMNSSDCFSSSNNFNTDTTSYNSSGYTRLNGEAEDWNK